MANTERRDYTVTPDCIAVRTGMEPSQLIIVLLEQMHKTPIKEGKKGRIKEVKAGWEELRVKAKTFKMNKS